MTPLEAVEAEAMVETDTYLLSTELGEAKITVPPIGKWRSAARHALIAQGDDYTWAQSTLSAEDFAAWVRCDPNAEESGAFFAEVMAANGENLGKSSSSARSSRSSRNK